MCLVVEGKARYFLLFSGYSLFAVCYYLAYAYPEMVIQHTTQMAYIDSIMTLMLVSGLICGMILFQNAIFRSENETTQKQKKELEKQLQILTEFANSNGYCVDKVYSDIASGLNFDRENFQKILFEVLDRKVKTLIIRDKDILSRVSFEMWKSLFRNFNCEIIVMNELQNNKSEEEEIFEDMISMIHCFAMRMYSSRRKKKIQLVVEDLKNELNND